MRSETIAIHGGYEIDPTTKAVAVPIYQTVAYAFDSADHGAALFNLEAEGYRYTRIANPTTAVLERRVAALEGGIDALCVSSGQAAVHYAMVNLTDLGSNIVSVPQLYGTTHTLFAHLLPSQGVTVRFAASDCAPAIEKLMDQQTRAVYCESVGNPAGNVCDIEALARVAHEHGVPLIVDNTVATPILLRPIQYGADLVVFYDGLKLIKRLVNLGDAKSLACHPASTTHRQMSPDEQRKAGVTPEMIRLSVGIEHIDDIIADVDHALDAMDSGKQGGAL